MISLEISDDADKEWNKRLEKSGLGTTSQIKEAATFTKFKNQKPVFLQFIDSTGKIVAQLLLSEFSRFESQPHKIKPSKKRIVANKFFKKIPGITKNVYRWSYGPLIFDSEKSAEVYEKLNSFLLSKGNQVSGWEHPLSHSHAHLLKKFKLIPWSTYIIDLNLPVDSLYENLEKHNCRKNIERSQKRDVIIEEINETNLKEYFDLRQQNKEMGGKKKT